MLKHCETLNLSNSTNAKMYINDQGDHDSSLLVEFNGINIFFQTDNILSLEEAKRIGKKHNIDIMFSITSLTGIYPGFFDFEVDQMVRLANDKKFSSYKYSCEIAKAMGATYVVPYATDLCYLGQLYFANDIHKTNKKDYKNFIKEQGDPFQVILMGPGDSININNREISFELSDHDFDAKKLGAYAVKKRFDVLEAEKKERCYEYEDYHGDIKDIRSSLDLITSVWANESYRVLWVVTGPNGEPNYFYHYLPALTSEGDKSQTYDLRIEIPSYRLQRLVRGDYKMGFLTLQNGAIRCHRHNEKLADLEKYFWNWAMLNLRFRQI